MVTGGVKAQHSGTGDTCARSFPLLRQEHQVLAWFGQIPFQLITPLPYILLWYSATFFFPFWKCWFLLASIFCKLWPLWRFMGLKENPNRIQLKDVPGISLWDTHPFLVRGFGLGGQKKQQNWNPRWWNKIHFGWISAISKLSSFRLLWIRQTPPLKEISAHSLFFLSGIFFFPFLPALLFSFSFFLVFFLWLHLLKMSWRNLNTIIALLTSGAAFFSSLPSAKVAENGSQAPQEHRKERRSGEWEWHPTAPVTLYMYTNSLCYNQGR